MKNAVLILSVSLAIPAWAALSVPLTVQEGLYTGGVAGVARTNEPFCMGVPIADSAGITSSGVFGLTGATAGQFRVLGTWPNGNYEWVKVCGILPSLSAGGTATVTLTSTGSGNFGGSNLAADNGATITVSTGAATFTIKKANFNVLDQVVVGSTTLVSSSSLPTRGLVLMGPNPTSTYPANVTCGNGTGQSPCTTLYSSANDANSSCTIEENGPVLAVVKCWGNHADNASHAYMHYTVRESFHKGKTSIKIATILRNANYDTSQVPSPDFNGAGTLNASDKQFQSYEIRFSAGITGTLNYTIPGSSSPQTGTLNQPGGTDSAYVYQGQSDWMTPQMSNPVCAVGSSCYNSFTTDVGYAVVRNGATLTSGGSSVYPAGYADVSDVNGNGVEIGMYQFAAQGPASLEFNAGGTDVRIGLRSGKNAIPSSQNWTSWKIFDSFVEFHAGAPESLANEFLKYQHYLVARPTSLSYINGTGVFPWRIVDPDVEDNYYINVANTATPPVGLNRLCWSGAPPCTPDRQPQGNVAGNAMAVGVVRGGWPWPEGGPLNQEEFRWADLLKFYQRGMTGRFLNSAHWYEWLAGAGWPHSDGVTSSDSTINGFTWRSRPHWGSSNAELDGGGRPVYACGGNCWPDGLHFHWYGYPDFYMMTGDETLREALLPLKDYYMNSETYQGGFNIVANGGVTARGVGIQLMGAARYSDFLRAVGDSDRANVLAQATNMYSVAVKPDPCVNGYPAGCTMPVLSGIGGGDPIGVSRVRGMHLGSRSQGFCPAATGPNYFRSQEPFQTSILMEGILSLRNSAGPGWSDNETALDLAYGLSQWGMTEGYNDNGITTWQTSNPFYNGFRYLVWADFANVCPPGTPVVTSQTFQVGNNVYDAYSAANTDQGMWFNFYLQYLTKGSTDWERQFKAALSQVAYHQSNWPADFGSYGIGMLIDAISSSGNPVLQDVPFTATNNGSGSYTLTWTVPAGAQSYRIKWSPKTIAPSNGLLSFDNLNTNTFGLSPAQYATWFGANNVTEPAPGASGQMQSSIISTGITGLTGPNFSVKAYVAGGGSVNPGPATSLLLSSGNGQTGTLGQPLLNPFVVKVTDANGNGVSGVGVSFAVTGGGGTLAATAVVTNGQGFASSTLTLGSNPGTNTVTATSGTLVGSPIAFTATGTASGPGPAANLVLVSGNGQTGSVGQPLASPFTVMVTDTGGNAVSNAAVAFSVTQGGGTLTATGVSTNSQGLAASILTLGPAAGANTVTVTSGTLAGSPVTFTATAAATRSEPAGVAWTKQTLTSPSPGGNGYLSLQYDPVSQQTILYGVMGGSTSIYSTDTFAYNSHTNIWTHISGTGSMVNSCTLDTSTMPGDRHPVGAMAVDSKRSFLWMYGGVNAACQPTINADGTTTITRNSNAPFLTTWAGHQVMINGNNYIVQSVTDSNHMVLSSPVPGGSAVHMYFPPPDISPRSDMYYMNLNADPANNTWHQVTPAHLPLSPGVQQTLVYDPDDDVLFAYGYDGGSGQQNNWVYCRTTENPVPGMLTPAQAAAGCGASVGGNGPDDWSLICVDPTHQQSGGGCLNPQAPYQPAGWSYPGLVYDTATKKIIQFGVYNPGTAATETYAYDVPTRTWTAKALSTTAPPVSADDVPYPAIAYDGAAHKLYYHQSTGAGAPSDWVYDPVVDTWTQLTSTGGGGTVKQAMAYDASANVLISWNQAWQAGLWQGVLGGASGSSNPCDLNKDGVVNILDVQSSISQALGNTACTTADLIGNGTCSVVDVQRVVTASLGGACHVGP